MNPVLHLRYPCAMAMFLPSESFGRDIAHTLTEADGAFFAACPEATEGDSAEEASSNLIESIALYFEKP